MVFFDGGGGFFASLKKLKWPTHPMISPPTQTAIMSSSTLEACECSICYDVIDLKTTGEVKLSCAHSFHFSCIASWFSTQEKGSCPCCRKEMGDKEDFAPNAPADGDEDEDEDEDDEDEDEDDEDECLIFNRSQLNALCQKLGSQRIISQLQWDAMCCAFVWGEKEFSAESQPLVFNFSELNAFFATHCSFAITQGQWLDMLAAEETPLTGAFESARLDFATPIDLPLQPFGLKERDSFLAAAASAAAEAEAMKVTWTLLENGSWTRTVFNPEEEMASILSPALTAAAAAASAAEAAIKLQAVWRGFSTRVRQVLPRLRVSSVWM